MHSSGKSGWQLGRESFNSSAGTVPLQRAGIGEAPAEGQRGGPGISAGAGAPLILAAVPWRGFCGEQELPGARSRGQGPSRAASVGFAVHLAANHA